MKKNIKLQIIWILGCLVLTLMFGMFWTMAHKGRPGSGHALVSEQVLQYKDMIETYADKYDIYEYTEIIEALMQQESGGEGTDVMQCSECIYNTEYSQTPGAIDDPEYSVETGVHYFATCLEMAKCRSPRDNTRLRLALQGYNYGWNYITWAQERDGGYTEENARAFSEMMQEELGWSGYGDPDYPQHVLRYYR